MTQAQVTVSPSPARVSRTGARSGDGAGDMSGDDVARDGGAGDGPVSFRSTLAAALGTGGSVGAALVAGDPQIPSIVAPAAEQVPVGPPASARGFVQNLLSGPLGLSGTIAGALQAKLRGNGSARTGRGTPEVPGKAEGDTADDGYAAKVDGSSLGGMVDQGPAAPRPCVVILPNIVASERLASGSANPAAAGAAGKPGPGPRTGAMGPAGVTPSGMARAPALPPREEAVLSGRAAPMLPPAGDAPDKSAASLGGSPIVPSGQSSPEGLVSLWSGTVGGSAPVATARGQAADVASTAYPAAVSGSVYPQIAPALVSLAGGPAGIQRLTLRLDPVELGLVQIRIDHLRDAPPEIRITADRPETLLLLQRDQLELHRALDHAGIPAEGRLVIFQAAASLPDAPAPTPAGASSSPPSFSAGLYSDGSGHGQAGQDDARSRFDGRSAEQDPSGFPPDGSGSPTNIPRWLRAGVDIFA